MVDTSLSCSKKRELYQAIDIDLLETQTNVKYEADSETDLQDSKLSKFENVINLIK